MARARHGVLLVSDLTRLGLDSNARQQAVAGFYRLARGAYAVDKPTSPEQWHFMRTVAAMAVRRGSLMASHVSGAVIHELPLYGSDLRLVHLSSDRAPRSARAGVVIHQTNEMATCVAGVPVTDVARTILDCARIMPRDQAVVMADCALHNGLTSTTALGAALGRLTGRGSSRARAVVALADGRAESVGETRTRLICVDAGIPVTPQVWLREADGTRYARVDLLVDGLPLVIEFDGADKYFRDEDEKPVDPAVKHWEEKVRRERIEDHGHIVVNIYWDMLANPSLVLAKIHRGMVRAKALVSGLDPLHGF